MYKHGKQIIHHSLNKMSNCYCNTDKTVKLRTQKVKTLQKCLQMLSIK